VSCAILRRKDKRRPDPHLDSENDGIDYGWAAGDPERFHRYAQELLAFGPDVTLASATPSVVALEKN
jgi:hypothetical protein